MIYRRNVLLFNQINSFQRLFKTSKNLFFTNDIKDIMCVKDTKENISISKEIHKYLTDANLEYFINYIPKNILKKFCKPSSTLYLFNHDTAKKISLIISEELLKNTSFIIECNPGIGLLTKELIKIGVPFINLYEKNEAFIHSNSPLIKLITEYKDQFKIKKLNVFDMWTVSLYDKHNDDNYTDDYLANAPYHAWENEPFAEIIAICPSRMFISLFIYNFINQTNIFTHGRPTCFLIIPSIFWQRAKADNIDTKLLRYYNQSNVIVHLFFEYKCLGEVPRMSFAPWPKVRSNSKINELELPMLVIKLEPKVNTFKLIKNEELKEFWFFLKNCMRSKKVRIIQEMEILVPGCGPRLIELDIDICTTFKELSPEKLYDLFKNIRSWPEYDKSFFQPSINDIKKEDEEKLEVEEEQEIRESVQ